MNNHRIRQMALSIVILSLMLSTGLMLQSAGATTAGGLYQKSITLTAGADGRAFAAVDKTYSYPSTQRVDFEHGFQLYTIDYLHYSPAPATYALPSPRFESPPSGFDPSSYSTGPLSAHLSVPKFLMIRNTSSDVVSPTITLIAKNNITLEYGVTTEATVDTLNILAAILGVSASDKGKLVAITGYVSGDSVDYWLYTPSGALYTSDTLDPGYFAIPFLPQMEGWYTIYLYSSTSSYIRATPTVVSATSLALGQFASGEMKIPETLDVTVFPDPEPSQVVAVSYDVSAGAEYAFSFSFYDWYDDISSTPSSFICYYFDVGGYEDGTPVFGVLGQGGSSPSLPIVSRAPIAGRIYVVLIGNYITRMSYDMGAQPTTLASAPLDESFTVQLPTYAGLNNIKYKFTLPAESVVRMNSTTVSGTMYYRIYRYSSEGILFTLGPYTVGTNYIASGLAENNYANSLILSAGVYLLEFYVASLTSSAKKVQINAYPIQDYTFGDSFDVTVHTTKALAIQMTNEFDWKAFNVTLLSHLNASMIYRMTLFDDYNRYIEQYYTSGSSSGTRGLGNKQSSGSWQGVPTLSYYVDPGPATTLWFGGNKTSQQWSFLTTYAGRYFLILDFRLGFDTTRSGADNANRWTFYNGLTLSLKIDSTAPNAAAEGYVDLKTLTIDSTSDTASSSVVLNVAGTNRIILKLAPNANKWTKISVSILNGTKSNYEFLYDRIRTLVVGGTLYYTFDPTESLGLWPAYTEVTNIYGYRNTTYQIEFGTIRTTMAIVFEVTVPGGAEHTPVSFSVSHYATPAFSGLAPAEGLTTPGAVSLLLLVIVIVAIVAVVVIVVAYVVLKKRSK